MIQILSKPDGVQILNNNYIGRLGFIWLGSPYILPITYYYSEEDHSIISYSEDGHKLQAMRKNPMVSFEVDEIESVDVWRSVLVHGTFEELDGTTARKELHTFSEGVKDLAKKLEHKEFKYISEFSSKINTGKIPVVFRIKVHGLSGRMRNR